MMGKKIVIGMSGGVDSSVAAYLLKKAGYEVIGVTMQTWQTSQNTKEAEHQDGILEDAKAVASALGIPHTVVDFHEAFDHYVKDYFVQEYLAGRTPNPCVVCNRHVKWEALLGYARSIGAEEIATGHYARICQLENGRYSLQKAVGDTKDQTYALYRLSQDQLAHTQMPVGEYTKDEIRAIAAEIGLNVANKPDSQEICFIPDQDYAGFIRRRAGSVPPKGKFVLSDGSVVGEHQGIIHYTVGQRKGLGIALGHPVFVTQIRPQTNEVVLGENEEVFGSALLCDQLHYMGLENFREGMEVTAKIRYNHGGAPCTLHKVGEDRLRVEFQMPQRAITPGQAVVFYGDGCVLGGGTILQKLSDQER